MFKYFLYKLGQFLVNRLSSNIVYHLAIFFSDMQYFFSPRDRAAVRNNLKTILNKNEDLAIPTKEVFRNFGRYLVEFFHMERLVDRSFIDRNVKIDNIDVLEKVKAEGKGGILVTGHLGNWELGSVVISLLGFHPVVIALPHKERPVNDLFNHQREVKGIRVIPTKKAVRQCLISLKNNEFVALAVDRDFSQNGEVLKFLGRRAIIPKGAAMFSVKTGAPIIPIFLIRTGFQKYNLSIEEPIYPKQIVDGQVKRQALISIMKKYVRILEEKIRLYPTQWLMFREFWVK